MTEEAPPAPPPPPADDIPAKSGVGNGDGSSSGLPLELIERDCIYHQTGEKENSFYKCLVEGFQSLREGREQKKKPLFSLDPAETPKPEDSAFKQISSHATVNFIDPTSVADDTPTSPKATAPPPKVLNVYEKISFIFQRDYGSTLRSVQFKSMRSGENDIISSLPVEMVLTRTGGGSANGDANAPWGGTATAPASDPSEWHNGPFCHVYIAACESMENYRYKVRPSLQAFVSQIESAAKTSSASKDQGGSAQYLIVYVPTGPKEAAAAAAAAEAEADAPTGPVRRVFANRIQKARQRITNYNADLGESHHSKESFDSDDVLSDNEDAETATTVALNLLSKNERNIYKKMAGEFANAKVCVMSPSSLDKSEDEAEMAIRTQEWNAFNRMLGTVIATGFKDRCRRYNEELRKLDTQRMFATTGMSPRPEGKGAKNKNPPPAYNPAHFFLVKESLAFTYEQMQLPAEALLQYDEFKAFLPDAGDKEDKKTKRARRKSHTLSAETNSPSLAEFADAGDYIAFRRKVRSEVDLAPIADMMRRYLFSRELCLLFKMDVPKELISRCHEFAKNMYATLMRDLPYLSPEDQRKRETAAAKWFVQFSWDVKSASEHFFSSLDISQSVGGDAMSVDTGSDMISDISDSSQSDHLMASQLSELLEVSRLFLKQLGDTELHEPNPVRAYDNKLPADMFKPWDYWSPIDPSELPESSTAMASSSSTKPSESKSTERVFLLEGAFESKDTYEDAYRELLSAIVTLSRFAERRRFAARLQGELAEYYIRRGDLRQAAAILKSIVKMCKSDQWDRCHFWRLFRLAYCQRSTSKPTDYLKTLVTCFSPRLASVAPSLALESLQEDLDVVMGHPDVGTSRYGKLVCLDTQLTVLETGSEESTMSAGVDEKKMLKRYCSVGENVRVSLSVTSYLPRPIYLESLKIFIVSFAAFSKIIESQESVEEEDAFQILTLDPPIELKPGKNTFEYNWKPATSGQFVLSTVEVLWKEGYFYYDSMELPAPLLGVDVIPTEPTHALLLEPGYLVPGQDQQLRLTFEAGSDMVTAGTIELSCAEGISLIPPDVDPNSGQWQPSCEIQLEPVKPGEQKVMILHVRCDLTQKFSQDSISQIPSFDSDHGLTAKAFTTYLHAEIEPENNNMPSMKTSLEAFAPILEKTALSVEGTDIVWVAKGEKAMLSICLMSNTPHHFYVEEWNLRLPEPLVIAEGGDLNAEITNCKVSDGDELALAFECSVSSKKDSKSVDEATLNVKLRDDDGKFYPIDLSIDLNEFYLHLWNSDLPKPFHLAASLELESAEGVSCEPVMMTYTVDISGLGSVEPNRDNKLLYSIVWDESDWLVGGKVDGVMDISDPAPSCQVVGIPISPGHLARFPSIDLRYVTSSGSTPVKVVLQHPKSFRSLAKVSETAIAFPTSKISV